MVENKKSRDEIAVHVDHVTKDFVLSHEGLSSIKSGIVNMLRRKKVETEVYHALKGVSFDIKKGEFFGIVGRNGSGKSTLLKIIAEIYRPTSGSVEVKGRLVPFIELGVGFNPELTGRENVYLNGALLGFSQKEVAAMYDDIVKFAELEEFMDQKLKNYSSGMQVRLAFSVAIQADADVLLIDEVLAVGDEAFQRKCLSYFAKLKKNKKTVIFVTHSMDAVQQFCDRVALIDKGHGVEIGSPLEISQLYSELNSSDGVTVSKSSDDKEDDQSVFIDAKVKTNMMDGKVVFDIVLSPKKEMKDPVVALGVYRDTGEPVYRWATDEKLPQGFDIEKHKNIRIEVDDIFPVGGFTVSLFVKKRDRSVEYAVFNSISSFEIRNKTPYKFSTLWRIPEKAYVNGELLDDVHRR